MAAQSSLGLFGWKLASARRRAARRPDDPEVQGAFAEYLENINPGRPQAGQCYEQALAIRTRLAQARPEEAERWKDCARVAELIGGRAMMQGYDPARVAAHYHREIAFLQRMLDVNPDDNTGWLYLATRLKLLGGHVQGSDKVLIIQEAVRIVRELDRRGRLAARDRDILEDLEARLDELVPPVAPIAKPRAEPKMEGSFFQGKEIGAVGPPSPEVPLSRFRGCLKFHRPEFHSPQTRAAFEFAFPRFLAPRLSTPEELENTRAALGTTRAFASPRNPRRYAGDFTLSAGSYFGICDDGTDDDHGTVIREIKAYRDPAQSGPVRIFDADDERIRNDFGISDDLRHAFLLFIHDLARFRAKCPPEAAEAIDWDAPEPPAFLFRYEIELREIDRVLDLRRREASDWLFRTFRLGDGNILLKHFGTNAQDFTAMLPTLLDPTHGGNSVTNAIGLWMRKSGVNALIYPSARSDAGVHYANGEMIAFNGWNLVDYRKTPAFEFIDAVLDTSPWSNEILAGASLRVSNRREDAHYGSWQMRGVTQAHQKLYQAQCAAAGYASL